MNNVKETTDNNICSGCGACSTVCNKISMKWTQKGFRQPEISDTCVDCGRCLLVCPAQTKVSSYFDNPIFKLVRNRKKAFVSYSINEGIRTNSASGGFITQILCDLLEANIIDGCIIATSDGTLENTKAIIAYTTQDIINAQSSKYMPISMCEAIKDMDFSKRYVFVGKGCDLLGLSLLEKNNKKLQNSIILKIGIMCAGSPSLETTKNLFKTMTGEEYKKEDSTFKYRSSGWPGDAIATKKTNSYKMPYSKSWCLNLSKGVPDHCRICTQHFTDYADICVGDAWFMNKSLSNNGNGFSLIIPYTETGEKFIISTKNIVYEECTHKDVLNSQENLFAIQEKITLYYFFKNFLTDKNPDKIFQLPTAIIYLLKHNYMFLRFCIGTYMRRKRMNKDTL